MAHDDCPFCHEEGIKNQIPIVAFSHFLSRLRL